MSRLKFQILSGIVAVITAAPTLTVFAAAAAKTNATSKPAAPPAEHKPQTPIEHNNRGVELGNKGLWVEAIHEHELAVEAEPHNKEFRTNLSAAQLRYGDVLVSKHDYYGAVKQYHGALYADENNLSAERNLDECLKHLGKNPDDLKTRLTMGEDAETSGDYETAIVEYRRCTKISDDGSYYARLGTVYRKAGKDVEAFNELKTAVTRPWSVESRQDRAFGLSSVHRMLGDILKQYAYIARKDGRQAIALKRWINAGIEYRRATTLNPGDLDSVQSLVEVAREAIAINPCFDNELTLAGAYQLMGDFEHARMEYDKCYQLDPNNAILGTARRSFYIAVVRSPTASADLVQTTMGKIETQLKKTPNDAELLYAYGRGKETQGSVGEALSYYEKAAAINPSVNTDLSQGLSRLRHGSSGGTSTSFSNSSGVLERLSPESVAIGGGTNAGSAVGAAAGATSQASYEQFEKMIVGGHTDEACKELMSYVQTHPQEAHAWLLLGNACEKKGDLDEASVAYRQAKNLKDPAADESLRQIDASRVQPLLKEADKYMADRNWVGASASLHDALTVAPNMPIVHRKLSEVLKQLGDDKESSRELRKAQELEK
jgi:tetratricopeptide (TPR) repeat protein